MSLSRTILIIACLLVVGVGGWLRLTDLDSRPLHFDEGTNARMLAQRLEGGTYVYDPTHYHGPMLTALTAKLASARGETSWKQLTVPTMRLIVAGAGFLVLAGALLIGGKAFFLSGVCAAAFVATSPLLVYYSRMFIHEMLFVGFTLFSLLALLRFLQRPDWCAALTFGLGVGWMAATRETVVISLFAWLVASTLYLWEQRRAGEGLLPKKRATQVLGSAGLCLLVIAIHYTEWFQHPGRFLDFFRTYFVYTPVDGHEKPVGYFVDMMLKPKQVLGSWWTEAAILLFAVCGSRVRNGRFLLTAGVVHALVYSLIAYKTPWLIAVAWLHLCLAAGIGVASLIRSSKAAWKLAPVILFALTIWFHTDQAHRASFRFATDARNPYAYVPTSKDLPRMATWLETLASDVPELKEGVLTVVGSAYWPLPWYVRNFESVGYWATLPEDAATRPLLLLMPGDDDLSGTHDLFPRGLRHEVPITVAIRKDLWEKAP